MNRITLFLYSILFLNSLALNSMQQINIEQELSQLPEEVQQFLTLRELYCNNPHKNSECNNFTKWLMVHRCKQSEKLYQINEKKILENEEAIPGVLIIPEAYLKKHNLTEQEAKKKITEHVHNVVTATNQAYYSSCPEKQINEQTIINYYMPKIVDPRF